jgi:hypothetical protein
VLEIDRHDIAASLHFEQCGRRVGQVQFVGHGHASADQHRVDFGACLWRARCVPGLCVQLTLFCTSGRVAM